MTEREIDCCIKICFRSTEQKLAGQIAGMLEWSKCSFFMHVHDVYQIIIHLVP